MSIPFVVQCKCYEYRKIGLEVIQQLEEVLSQKSRNTIGILVIPNKKDFTRGVKYRVKISKYNILLTDRDNIIIDLLIYTKIILKYNREQLEDRKEQLENEIDLLENNIDFIEKIRLDLELENRLENNRVDR